MSFSLTILGVNAATPAFGRFPTSQVLQAHNHYFLLDCGEGTQMRMSDFSIPRHKIQQIFISHLHGDHVFGLPGLLFSYDLNGRQTPLHIYAPHGLEAMVAAQLRPGGSLSYPLHFHVVDTQSSNLVFENETVTVQAIPLKHGIPTVGYVFREKPRPLNIRSEKIAEHQLSIPQIKAAKSGEDVLLENGILLRNAELTLPPAPLCSYAFLTDTMADDSVLPYIEGVSLLYHDTTFCDDFAENAALTMHSTARQAAELARKAGVGQLICGHYSSRYRELGVFLEEAKPIFENTVLGEEGMRYSV
ncbi:MAG: ribonuclease Z [Saprospiraceae bacterium]|nr:ribonuclease Z [Saprospiraceae bacterium]